MNPSFCRHLPIASENCAIKYLISVVKV